MLLLLERGARLHGLLNHAARQLGNHSVVHALRNRLARALQRARDLLRWRRRHARSRAPRVTRLVDGARRRNGSGVARSGARGAASDVRRRPPALHSGRWRRARRQQAGAIGVLVLAIDALALVRADDPALEALAVLFEAKALPAVTAFVVLCALLAMPNLGTECLRIAACHGRAGGETVVGEAHMRGQDSTKRHTVHDGRRERDGSCAVRDETE